MGGILTRKTMKADATAAPGHAGFAYIPFFLAAHTLANDLL